MKNIKSIITKLKGTKYIKLSYYKNKAYSMNSFKNVYEGLSTSKKNFISYIILLIIPTLLIFSLSYFLFTNYSKNEIVKANKLMLSQLSTLIENKINEMHEISVSISLNSRLNRSDTTQSSYSIIEAVEEMRKYKRANSFYSEVMLYSHATKAVISSYGVHNVDDFIKNTYVPKEVSKESIYEIFENTDSEKMHPAMNFSIFGVDKSIIICTISIGSNNFPISTVVFFIDEQTILEYMKNIFKEYDGVSFIFDEKGESIAATKDDVLLKYTSKEMKKIISIPSGFKKEKINNKDYFLSYIKSDKNNFAYLTLLDAKKVFSTISSIQRIITVSLIIILIVGILIINYLIKVNYKPIDDFIKNISLLSSKNASNKKLSDVVSTINEVVSDNIHLKEEVKELSDKNFSLKAKIDEAKPIVQKQILFSLINGSISEMSDFQNVFENIDLKLDTKFLVCVFGVNKTNISQSRDIVLEILNELQNKKIKAYILDMLYDNKLVFVFSNFSENINTMMTEVSSTLNKLGLSNIKVGVGNVYYNLIKISQSYLEALTALEFSMLKSGDSICYFNSIDSNQANISYYPHEEITQLITEINIGNIKNVENIINKIISNMTNNNIPISMAKCLYYDIINTVIRMLYKLNIKLDRIAEDKINTLFISKITTYEELNNIISTVFNEINHHIKNDKKQSMNKIKNNVIDFINENYEDNNLSVESIADRLNINYPHLSRYFKQKTGMTIIGFITKIRLENAKKLLINTNIPIKDIILKVGYLDIANFNRKFKEIEKMPPSEYRKKYQS